MYYLTILPEKYVLLSEDSLRTCLEPILRVLYGCKIETEDSSVYPKELIQLHMSSDEVSIIIPEKYREHFDTLKCTLPYRALRVDTENPGLEESGILNVMTNLFSKHNIPILSVSTYNYNYIFIPCADIVRLKAIALENKTIIELDCDDE